MSFPDRSKWQFPNGDHFILGPQESEYALVIPVINEGDRIRNQLRRLAMLNLGVDIIIADGGSTDGSLDVEFLREHRVRALLIKRGPGRVGAQLRLAYAWCLDENYKGVITIDGNGKDNVEAITSFVSKLHDGFDYVQGSRYVTGGKALNTPLNRRLATRLIHAPVLSLVGHHLFTDTTNGYRAYSARYLTDPRVAPFRDVFMLYELLFYLTARAGQLGYNVIEIPVTRSYPENGKTPTKISGFGGRIAILRQLFGVAFGLYNP